MLCAHNGSSCFSLSVLLCCSAQWSRISGRRGLLVQLRHHHGRCRLPLQVRSDRNRLPTRLVLDCRALLCCNARSGTSASTPLIASMITFWNDILLTNGRPPIGYEPRSFIRSFETSCCAFSIACARWFHVLTKCLRISAWLQVRQSAVLQDRARAPGSIQRCPLWILFPHFD